MVRSLYFTSLLSSRFMCFRYQQVPGQPAGRQQEAEGVCHQTSTSSTQQQEPEVYVQHCRWGVYGAAQLVGGGEDERDEPCGVGQTPRLLAAQRHCLVSLHQIT